MRAKVRAVEALAQCAGVAANLALEPRHSSGRRIAVHVPLSDSGMLRSLVQCPRNAPSDGCSKPQSTIARISSGFSRKSLKPEL